MGNVHSYQLNQETVGLYIGSIGAILTQKPRTKKKKLIDQQK